MNVDGKKIVLGGKFDKTKKEIKARLEELGAKVAGKVSGTTDLVFVGLKSSGSREVSQAKGRGIPWHSAKELNTLLKEGNDELGQASTDESVDTPGVALEEVTEFEGKTVAVTGKFALMKRTGVNELLSALGAHVAKSVTKNTDLLIYGDGAGSKLDKAFKYGADVISELEMVELLERDPRLVERVPDARAIIAREIARQQAALPEVRKIVGPVQERQRAQWGATLDELLLAYIQVFSKRRDIVVTGVKRRRKTGQWQLKQSVYTKMPDEVIALFYNFGGIQFHYVFEEDAAASSKFSEGYNGGHLNLIGINNFRWYPMEKWQKEADGIEFKATGMFDSLQAEGYCDLSYDEGETSRDAGVVFDDSNDVSRTPIGSVEFYLTQGARSGFVWYWPKAGYWEAEKFKTRLFDRALPRDTAREVVEKKLVEQGLDAGMARAMYAWLGPDSVILLHASQG